MSNLYDLFGQEETEQKPRNNQKWQAEQKANREYCYAQIEKSLETVGKSPELFQGYLNVQANFEYYTARNALLIQAQRETATKIADNTAWKEQGIFVKQSEFRNPILILEPGNPYTRDDGTTGQSFNAKKMYDITQTTCRVRSQNIGKLDDRMLIKSLISKAPVKILTTEAVNHPLAVDFDMDKECVVVEKGLEPDAMYQGIATALAKAELALNGCDAETLDFKAQAAAYMLCRQADVSTACFDFSKLPDFLTSAEPQQVGAELTTIKDAMAEVSMRVKYNLQQMVQPKSRADPAR